MKFRLGDLAIHRGVTIRIRGAMVHDDENERGPYYTYLVQPHTADLKLPNRHAGRYYPEEDLDPVNEREE